MADQTQQEKNAHENGQQLIHSFNATEYSQGHFYGLTKREYFAGLVLKGLLSNTDLRVQNYEEVVSFSLVYTDELLKQLAK